MKHALIDGDVLKYEAGFASDANAKRLGKSHEPLAFCLHIVKDRLNTILIESGCNEYTIYLTNPGASSREEVFPEYKANRDTSHKPHWFAEIHEFLVTNLGAVYSTEGDEADDAMGIAQSDNTVICTKDKDLDMIVGWHYNWSKTKRADGCYYVDELDADRFFYKQLLTGDGTDNIPGMYKRLGIKASKKYTAPIDEMDNVVDMYKHVLSVYDNDREFISLIGKLLWIKRCEGEEWSPPLV